jgi:hypothetical protein
MSLNVTPGSGVVIAADQVGTASAPATGQLIQYVKVDVGAAGSSSPVTAAAPLPAQITNGTAVNPTGPGNDLITSSGGKSTVSVASGSGNTVIKASASRLCRVLVTTVGTGTGNVIFYDNATTNSGTIIGQFLNTLAVNSYITFDTPAANGITVANVASGPVFTVSYL